MISERDFSAPLVCGFVPKSLIGLSATTLPDQCRRSTCARWLCPAHQWTASRISRASSYRRRPLRFTAMCFEWSQEESPCPVPPCDVMLPRIMGGFSPFSDSSRRSTAGSNVGPAPPNSWPDTPGPIIDRFFNRGDNHTEKGDKIRERRTILKQISQCRNINEIVLYLFQVWHCTRTASYGRASW